jgi:RNA polymerase sigma factor (sigma-70 family)
MTNSTAQGFTDHMQVLFGVGTCAGMTDGQLLERFLAERNSGGELAFEALVARHGPMVMRVCRNLLNDPHDVHDAFQAVFLVLARRAGAIRDRDSVGGWLYGVAVRVAARARVSAIRRNIRDRRTTRAAQSIAAVVSNQNDASTIDRNEGAEIVHHELGRLPEKYRAPVVLCYLEGLTHDEAAARLCWPVGTVRSRLARARDTLRSRLARRGVTTPAALGSASRWLAGDRVATSDVFAEWSATISREFLASTAQTVAREAAGRTAAAKSISSTSLSLAQEILTTMFLNKMLIIACISMPLGAIAIGGGALLTQKSLAQGPQSPQAASGLSPQAATKNKDAVAKPPEVDPLLQQSLDAAIKRIESQRAYYEEGRITLDRFMDACRELELAQLMAAQTGAERTAIKERHVVLLKEIENREQAELVVGRGTASDVAEVVQKRIQAETELKTEQDLPSILRRLSELERKVEELQRNRAVK